MLKVGGSTNNERHVWNLKDSPKQSTTEEEWSSYRRLGHTDFWVFLVVNVACTVGGEEVEPLVTAKCKQQLKATHQSIAFKCAHEAFSHRNWDLSSSIFYYERQLYFICIFVDEHRSKSFSLSSWDFYIFNKYLLPSVVDVLLFSVMLDTFLHYFRDSYSEVTPCYHPMPWLPPLYTWVEFSEREIDNEP